MSTGLHTVHVRVNDAATGQPTPVRLRITSPEGEYYAPFGRLADFGPRPYEDSDGNVKVGDQRFAYIDGTCEIRLPAGPILVEAHKGPEYRPLQRPVTLSVGQITLRLAVERWTDLRQQGWFSGDMRVHDLSPHAALFEAAAEDVAVVNLLAYQRWKGPVGSGLGPYSVPNILAFSGQRPALERPGHLVVVNTYNTQVAGNLALLNCHRAVYPLSVGWADTTGDYPLTTLCDQCHRKGGLVVWSDPGSEFPGEDRLDEPLASLILGKVDALEACGFDRPQPALVSLWYELLNCGCRIPLVGASAKGGTRGALGGVRTYARLSPDTALSYQGWIEAVRAGRTFVTNGPLLFFTVDGQDPGTLLDVPTRSQPVAVRAQAQGGLFQRLELIADGVVIASAGASHSGEATLEMELPLSASGWLGARCWGEPLLRGGPGPTQCPYAHTAPVFVRVEGRPLPARESAVTALTGHLDRLLTWVRQEARFPTDRARETLTGVFEAAKKELAGRRGS